MLFNEFNEARECDELNDKRKEELKKKKEAALNMDIISSCSLEQLKQINRCYEIKTP